MTAVDLPIARVYANPHQPRKIFEPLSLQDLAASIRNTGLIQPITVVPRHNANGDWMIVAGERRYRASLLAKAQTIKAIVREDLSDEQVNELALIENLLRENITIVEEARAFQSFIDKGHTVDTLAALLGFQQAWRVQERLNLLKLHPDLLTGVEKGAIGASQAQEMSRLSHEGQFRLWHLIQDGKCSGYTTLRRTASALLDQENQRQMFRNLLSPEEKQSLGKVDKFIGKAGQLLSLVDDDDLKRLEFLKKSNAAACADQLALLEKLCRELRNALLTNAAKQQVLEAGR